MMMLEPAYCREMIDLTAKHHARRDRLAAERIRAIPTPQSDISFDALRDLIFEAAKKEK
jgi:hypothetical protein